VPTARRVLRLIAFVVVFVAVFNYAGLALSLIRDYGPSLRVTTWLVAATASFVLFVVVLGWIAVFLWRRRPD
jgi:L-lactate permease